MCRPADVAQLVEHFTRNEGVPGSNPGVGFAECCLFDPAKGRRRRGQHRADQRRRLPPAAFVDEAEDVEPRPGGMKDHESAVTTHPHRADLSVGLGPGRRGRRAPEHLGEDFVALDAAGGLRDRGFERFKGTLGDQRAGLRIVLVRYCTQVTALRRENCGGLGALRFPSPPIRLPLRRKAAPRFLLSGCVWLPPSLEEVSDPPPHALSDSAVRTTIRPHRAAGADPPRLISPCRCG